MDTIKVKTIHEITFSSAEKLLQFGLEEATKKNLKLSIAIVDRAGQLITFARMDGASIVTIDVAIGKAKTGAYLQAPSKVFEDFINNGLPSMATTPGILPLQGGIPIMYNDEVIGAVGVSGSTGESDNEMATNIANHIN